MTEYGPAEEQQLLQPEQVWRVMTGLARSRERDDLHLLWKAVVVVVESLV